MLNRLIISFMLLMMASLIQAEPTNFRAGVSLFRSNTSPAPDYMPGNKEKGYSLFAEMPQSNNTATRLIIYHLDDQDKHMQGFETQLMWGIGLAEPGFRLYTGPAWHREGIKINRPGKSYQVFNGWGWQLGTGFQFRAITLDLAATFRDNRDYHSENKRAGLDKKPESIISNLMISYRF